MSELSCSSGTGFFLDHFPQVYRLCDEMLVICSCASLQTEQLREELAKHTQWLAVVNLQSTKCGNEAARMLTSFPNIRSINWWCTPVSGADLLACKLSAALCSIFNLHVWLVQMYQ